MGSCDVVPGRSDTLGVDRHSFSSFTFVSYIAKRPIIIDRIDEIRMGILYYKTYLLLDEEMHYTFLDGFHKHS